MLLMRSLRDMNLSKLVSDDIPLFNSLLSDIFPNVKNVPKVNYPEIEKGVKEQVEKKGLIYYDSWILKNI
jgi:dynein heavy chain